MLSSQTGKPPADGRGRVLAGGTGGHHLHAAQAGAADGAAGAWIQVRQASPGEVHVGRREQLPGTPAERTGEMIERNVQVR